MPLPIKEYLIPPPKCRAGRFCKGPCPCTDPKFPDDTPKHFVVNYMNVPEMRQSTTGTIGTKSSNSNAPGTSRLTPDWDQVITKCDFGRNSKVIRHEKPMAMTREEVEFIVPQHLNTEEVRSKFFWTGSVYFGNWCVLGMIKNGMYILPHGVEYIGFFKYGRFNGEGQLTYPAGSKFNNIYDFGRLIHWSHKFNDGLAYKTPWRYCRMPDRRFFAEIEKGMRPAGKSYTTPAMPSRDIPEGCYDTGDGFFDPKIKCVYSAQNHNNILRVVKPSEEKWIKEHCRKAWDEPVGYRPDLYEKWTTGEDANDEELFNETNQPYENYDNYSEYHFNYTEMEEDYEKDGRLEKEYEYKGLLDDLTKPKTKSLST